MDFIPIKTPKMIISALPNLVWHLPSRDKSIYLTFDDGPTPKITDWTLETLKAYNAKATFFCIGDNIKKHPEIFNRIHIASHAIGNHTFNHLKGWRTKTQNYIENTLKAQNIIDSTRTLNTPQNSQYKGNTNQNSTNPNTTLVNYKLFRPPHGRLTPKQAKQLRALDYKIVMWNILSKDWNKKISKEKCLENVIQNTSSGDIVVFHDSLKAAKNMQYALPRVLEHFSKRGFQFKRIPVSH
ncbi:MAG: polysaccharide deacetylase family protein [Flavobacteriaceae bacterium]|nr:polysaccharide deacetylase family protein [Flavobacteriaceae bacterium]